MNLKIGQIIKRLRQEKEITQEQLANALFVSPQAISRWESGACYPDIESLPMLADVFSVSVDELIGYKLSEREEELSAIKKEIDRLSEVGNINERIAFARESLAKYPLDFEIKENLAVCLYFLWHDTDNTELLKEIENLSSSVIAECKDENTRYGAINLLVNLYADTKQSDKAKEIIKLLTPMKYCREFAMASGIGDGNTEIYIQDNIDKLADALGIAIRNYTLEDELPNDPTTWDKKIEMLNISNKIYSLIYGDNLMFYHGRLSQNYWLISTFEISQGKEEEALCSLEKMCYHTVECDKSYVNDHGKMYTSILTDKLVYPEPSKDFHELTEHSQCYYKLDRLQHKRYDVIRNNDRFIAIVKELEKNCK